MYAIETHNLTKSYTTHFGRKAAPSLDSLNLAVDENEIFGFLGKNGAGKTTAIKILCGLLRQSHGSASIFGVDVRKRASRKYLGFLPENPYFYEYLTPRETLDFYGRLDGLSSKERAADWDKLSELLDLRDIGNQRLREFSKGMRQRLGFAVALVGNPAILILDEPMSGLDPLGRRSIRELILLMRDLGKTIFFSSHVLGDVEQICDRVGILVEGKLQTLGRIDELLTRRVHTVEIIVKDVSDVLTETLRAEAVSTRDSEDGLHVILDELDHANEVARKIYEGGGKLLEFIPVKESLEDYFVREQEGAE